MLLRVTNNDVPGHEPTPSAEPVEATAQGAGRSFNTHHELKETPQGAEEDAKSGPKLPWFAEIVLIVAAVLAVVGLFQNFVGRQYVIPSASMEPTLHGCQGCTGDRIFTEKLSYMGGKEPQPGDVIVFEGTDSWNELYISPRSSNPTVAKIQDALSYVSLAAPDENTLVKRVIATGGQTIQCLAGDPGIMVDGKEIDSSYIQKPHTYQINPVTGSDACGGDYFGPITVPAHHLFMMGDNRTNSMDSRYHMDDGQFGTIPVENVRGKVRFIFFPFTRIAGVESRDIQG